ncbi:MAG: PVC-type heme-binding CxxCH protein [Isosphaeraceae bacterium]
MPARARFFLTALSALLLTAAGKPDGNRLAYLDENNPYYPGLNFPKLTTPQWVGEPGVEAVVVLAIDDMRDPAKYETYLRPILNRLKAIDGRAPVSIMTCKVKPDDPQLRSWIKEGLNFDVHTLAHPCPLLQKEDFQAARDTVDGCTDLLHQIPGNKPVAFRMPCCDSLNTPSPRFFSEIFNRTTPGGHFLSIDSSVFNIITPADPALPRSLVEDPDGGERFRKYLPFKSFVNTIENYPYPYVINRLCWEFPCVVPSDWEAQNLQKPNNPKTVEDMKAALDAIVLKQGVFNLVFHPHGWIKGEQIVELIDHAVAKYGKKVKFLNFREALDRLNANLLAGEPLRTADGEFNGVRVLDLDNDGFMDVFIDSSDKSETRLWQARQRTWAVTQGNQPRGNDLVVGVLRSDGAASALRVGSGKPRRGGWDFENGAWRDRHSLIQLAAGEKPPFPPTMEITARTSRLKDIDHDGLSELFVSDFSPQKTVSIYYWSAADEGWKRLPFGLPGGARLVGAELEWRNNRRPVPEFGDSGTRFVDLDEDGDDDLVYSKNGRWGVYLFESPSRGWSIKVADSEGKHSSAFPQTARGETDNGFWVHSRHLWWQNEDTAKLPDLVDRRSFNDLLKNVPPQGKSAEAALKAIRVRPGFKVEFAATEPLVLDPIAFDWGADGRLWVVEMGDYPLGVDGKGKSGGVVRVLEDKDQDGRYDAMSTFLDGLGFPSGLMPWRNGVLVACAPDIFYAEDRDGDGKADFKEILFTGFHPGNQQHRLNGFELGLDGWVYGANGDSGGQVRSLKTGKTVNIRGRDFRFRPDTGEFETESGQTQYGRHRDDFGRWFGNNNPNWGWTYMLSEADARRNPAFAAPDPRKTLEPDTRLYPVSYTAPRFNDLWAAGRVTSANSATPYRDELFGPHFSNSLFVSDPVHNLVHRMVLQPDGPGFKGVRAPGEADREFLASSDAWFRPTMLKTGPDGALWVADMDRAVIEHPEWIPDDWEKRLDLRAGADRGRIIRVLPVEKWARPIPDLSKLDTPGLVAAIDSPNGWQRDTAHRLLLHRNDPAAAGPLRELVRTCSNEKAVVQALWILENLGVLQADDLTRAFSLPSPGARRNALQLSARFLSSSPALANAVRECIEKGTAEERYQAVLALGVSDAPEAGRLIARVARRDGADPWFRAAVLCSAGRHVGGLLAGLFTEGAGPPPVNLVEPLFALAGRAGDRSGLLGLIQAVADRPEGSKTHAAWQFAAAAGLLDAARRAGQPLDRWAGAGEGMAKAVARLDELFGEARTVVADPKASEEDRLAALGLVGRDPRQRDAERSLVTELLKPQVPARVQVAGLSAVAKGADPKLPEVLLAAWKGLTPALRTGVLDTLLSREEWSAALLSSLEDTCVPPAEIDPAHRRGLVEHPSSRLRDRARAVFGAVTGARQTVVDSYREALKSPGDPKVGAAVFQRVCATCHKFRGVGYEVGPDLAALNDRSPEAILTAVLDPNRAVEAKFTGFSVQTTDGRVLNGLIASETAGSITLRRQDGKEDLVPRAEIEAMAGTGQSLMPEGLEKDLSRKDLADLISYLNAK